MSKKILIDASYPDSVQVAVVEKNRLVDLESSTNSKKMIKGNIYLAKVTRVEPSLQAAFIDYGEEKNGFISFAEIHSDYYNVPSKYRKDSDDAEEHDDHDAESETFKDESEYDSMEPEAPLESDLDHVIDEIIGDDLNVLEDPNTKDLIAEEADIEKIKKENLEKYKIQEVIKRNQIFLVQVVKEERGNKGASFTTYISLAGRCCVIMPNSGSKGGVSKKIEDAEERRRLKIIVDEVSVANPVGVIIRTVGQGRSKDRIENDYNYLVKLWNDIREKTLISTAPAFIHSEENLFKRVVRDLYDNSVEEVLIEGREAYNEMHSIIQSMSSEDELKLNLYQEKVPIFNKYKIDEQILNLYNPVAYTDSGAYIVINPTEALISIDVNSGRSTSEKNIEKMAVRTNLEAAKEIIRQIRLRDLSGIIVIDFIDMVDVRNKRLVEKTFKDMLYRDRAKVQMGHISSLGLLEVSRQRLKPNFLEANTVICTHCHGKGVVRSHNSNSITILKTVEGEVSDKIAKVNVFASPDTVLYMLNHKRDAIKRVEEKHGIEIFFQQDHKMSADGFAIEVVESESKRYANQKSQNGQGNFAHKKDRNQNRSRNNHNNNSNKRAATGEQVAKVEQVKQAPRIEQVKDAEVVVDAPSGDADQQKSAKQNRRRFHKGTGKKPQQKSEPSVDATNK